MLSLSKLIEERADIVERISDRLLICDCTYSIFVISLIGGFCYPSRSHSSYAFGMSSDKPFGRRFVKFFCRALSEPRTVRGIVGLNDRAIANRQGSIFRVATGYPSAPNANGTAGKPGCSQHSTATRLSVRGQIARRQRHTKCGSTKEVTNRLAEKIVQQQGKHYEEWYDPSGANIALSS